MITSDRRLLLMIAALVFFSSVVECQETALRDLHHSHRRNPPPSEPALAAPVFIPGPDVVPDGFKVRLRLTRVIDPSKVHLGDVVPLVLASDLYYRDLLLAREGAPVVATVRKSESARSFGRGSRLDIDVESLSILDGRRLPLRGLPSEKGASDRPVGLQVSEAIHLAAIFPPAIPLSLLLYAQPGKTAALPADTLVMAFVDGDKQIDVDRLSALNSLPSGDNTAQIRIVRGQSHSLGSADLFCNGKPIAHLRVGRRLELRLQPGWYRFSIKPDRSQELLYLVSAKTYYLVADSDEITEVYPREVNEKTVGWKRSDRARSAVELFAVSRDVKEAEMYPPVTCSPLLEQLAKPKTER